MRISDWSADVCSSDLEGLEGLDPAGIAEGSQVPAIATIGSADVDHEVDAVAREQLLASGGRVTAYLETTLGELFGDLHDGSLDEWHGHEHRARDARFAQQLVGADPLQ